MASKWDALITATFKAPGDDMSEECAEMQAVATALWTDEVVAAYQAMLAAQQLPGAW